MLTFPWWHIVRVDHRRLDEHDHRRRASRRVASRIAPSTVCVESVDCVTRDLTLSETIADIYVCRHNAIHMLV